MRSGIRLIPILSLLLLGLPLAGIALGGKPIHSYLEFPPRTHYVVHLPFTWMLFILTCLVGLLALAGISYLLIKDRRKCKANQVPRALDNRRLPWWGWAGLALMLGSWFLAWNRFAWFVDLQRMTFTPIWLGYIVFINAWTWRREGQCLLTDETRYLVFLFPLSTLFWWYFEYLNRFVQNWFYLGVDEFSPLQYALLASLAFTTVLPAVISTQQWLRSMFGLRDLPVPTATVFAVRRTPAIVLLLLSSLALILLGLVPNLLFPFLWFAPLLLLFALQGIHGEPDLVLEFRRRGWQVIYLPALAALQCGFFWELWNYHSLAKWVYEVPFAGRFKIFEMPVAGFTGYLPFGIECLAIALLIRPPKQSTTR